MATRDDADPADVRWSPVYGDLTGLPPMLVQLAGRDPLHDDGARLAERAQSCGVNVTVTEYPESAHSWILRGTNPRDGHAEAAYKEAAEFILSHAHRHSPSPAGR
jgi:acetyl esterase/lipase